MSSQHQPLVIIGAGSWGTALALYFGQRGYAVDLWVYEPQVCERLQQTRENSIFLPGYRLPENVRPATSLESVVRDKSLWIWVTPSHVVRGLARELKAYLKPQTLVVNASKGLEDGTLLTISGILEQELGSQATLACVSGPTFAAEIARQAPSAMVAAADSLAVAERVQALFASPRLRVFTSTDRLGVELGGALKNVIAIAAGICDGLQLGYNARAGLITRGLVEITRIGTALGARPETFSGLSGLGDLVLTCTGDLSRNRTLGMKLAQGQSLEEITQGMQMVAEGILTVRSARALKEKLGIQASIIEETYLILYEGKSPRQALEDLMKVDIAHEFSGVKGLQ